MLKISHKRRKKKKKKKNYFVRNDLTVTFNNNIEEFEILFIEILNKNKNIIIGVVYRHPKGSNTTEFLNELNNILQKIGKEKKKVIIMGDFNIDLLKVDCHSQTESFLDIMLKNFFLPHITQPTRFNEKGSYTLIDNIFSNDIFSENDSGNLLPHLSDHLPNFTIFKDKVERHHSKKLFCDFSSLDLTEFSNDFENMNILTKLKTMKDTNTMYHFFHTGLSLLLDMHAPLRTKTKTEIKQSKKPWVSENLLKTIAEKNRLYTCFLKRRDTDALSRYKILRNEINHTIRRKKYEYYKNFFEKNRNNVKKCWRGINEILERKRKHTSPFILKKENNEICSNSKEIFVNVAPTLVSKLPKKSVPHYRNYLNNENPYSFFSSPILKEEINSFLSLLDESKATDIYEFPIKVMKDIKDIIDLPLSYIINNSFCTGVFPDMLKYARVTPLYKGGEKCEANNYRPASILPIFDKIFEKVMHKQLMEFLEKHKILTKNQYGRKHCRKGRNTVHAVIDLVSKISLSLQNKEKAHTIFLDFAKAFDTVNHDILLQKLNHYGIRGVSNKWFE